MDKKQFKIYFENSDVPDNMLAIREESIIVEAGHDKEAVLKFSKIVPNAFITEIIEIRHNFKEE